MTRFDQLFQELTYPNLPQNISPFNSMTLISSNRPLSHERWDTTQHPLPNSLGPLETWFTIHFILPTRRHIRGILWKGFSLIAFYTLLLRGSHPNATCDLPCIGKTVSKGNPGMYVQGIWERMKWLKIHVATVLDILAQGHDVRSRDMGFNHITDGWRSTTRREDNNETECWYNQIYFKLHQFMFCSSTRGRKDG